MKKLYLIRHAKSDKDIPGITDIERPLNSKGKRDAQYMGGRLKKCGIMMQVLYSSPARRALDTARRIAKKIGFPRSKIEIVGSIYESNIPKLLKVIKNIDDAVESAGIFGHNPDFLDLVNYLSTRPVGEFPACGVFGIDFKIDSWRGVSRKKGRIVFFEGPEK